MRQVDSCLCLCRLQLRAVPSSWASRVAEAAPTGHSGARGGTPPQGREGTPWSGQEHPTHRGRQSAPAAGPRVADLLVARTSWVAVSSSRVNVTLPPHATFRDPLVVGSASGPSELWPQPCWQPSPGPRTSAGGCCSRATRHVVLCGSRYGEPAAQPQRLPGSRVR